MPEAEATGGRRRVMIEMDDADRRHFEDWQRLTPDEKQTAIEVTKLLSRSENRKSLGELLRDQAKISALVQRSETLGFVYTAVLKGAGLITALGVIAVAAREFFGRP